MARIPLLRYCRGHRRYFEPLAVAEAFVSITSGVLIWMGFWDFIDTYVVPERWWAKLLMIVFGAIGLFCTRTLYDKEMLHAIRASTGLGERPDAGLLPLHTDSAAPTTPGLPEISRRRSHPGSHDGRPPSRSQSVHPHRRHSVVRETVVIGSAALGMQMLAEKRTSPETRSRAATVGSAPARLYHRYDEGPGAPDARIRSMTMV